MIENKIIMWHARLGHAHHTSIHKIIQLSSVSINNKDPRVFAIHEVSEKHMDFMPHCPTLSIQLYLN